MKTIPFSPPDISQEEIDGVVEVLKSGWITTGPKTKEFERKIADYLGVERAVCLNSATAALELTLRLLGVGPGDEVIVPAMTYTASCSVIEHVGATPVLVDIHPEHFEMNHDLLAEAITERTKVIIPVDIAGIPANYEKIFEVVESKKALFSAANDLQALYNRVIVVSDAAHAFGSTYKGTNIGNVGDFSCFSFHAVKNLTTAEGGCVTWKSVAGLDSEDIYRQFQVLSLHGQTKDALSKTKPGSWEYDIVIPGYKCNMTDLMAAIGLAQLDRYEDLKARRKVIVDAYDAGFEGTRIHTIPHSGPDYESTRHLYSTHILGASFEQRGKIIEAMAEKGIACNVHYKPLPLLTAYKNMGFKMEDYPNAYQYYSNEITLPLHTLLSDEDVAYVIDSLKESVGEVLDGK